MPAKLTVPAVTEVRAVAAMVGEARGDRKEEWESDSGAIFHMSHTRVGMSAYKKASPGTTVEIADGNIVPVDGFGRIEGDLDQPSHNQDGEDGRCCVRVGILPEPAVYHHSSEAMGKTVNLL